MYEKKMSSSEVNKNIRQCFTQRVSVGTQVPMELSEEEASQLLRIASVNILLFSFAKYGRWLQQKKAEGKELDHAHIFKGLITCIENTKRDDGRIKTAHKSKATQQLHEKRTLSGVDPERVIELREVFQDVCTDSSWCITEHEAQEMLRQHDMNKLRRVFSELGQTFPAEQAQECVDLVEWKLTTAA